MAAELLPMSIAREASVAQWRDAVQKLETTPPVSDAW